MCSRYLFIFFVTMALIPKPGFTQQTPASSTQISKYLTEAKWNDLFPHRYGIGLKDARHQNPDFYTFSAFAKAAGFFPHFLSDGNDESRKRELAAFLANIAQETSGGWQDAPGGYFKWGLYFLEENRDSSEINRYADSTKKNYPPVPGAHYHGRGPLQLSWNYNYGKFSEMWFGRKEDLLENPDLLLKDPVLAFASAIWFWMTPQGQKPSCHDIMVGQWIPNGEDSLKGRMPGFGLVVNVINGVVECGHPQEMQKTHSRYLYYRYFCEYFQVNPGENISCGSQKPYGH
jgi:hypothetical protein